MVAEKVSVKGEWGKEKRNDNPVIQICAVGVRLFEGMFEPPSENLPIYKLQEDQGWGFGGMRAEQEAEMIKSDVSSASPRPLQTCGPVKGLFVSVWDQSATSALLAPPPALADLQVPEPGQASHLCSPSQTKSL
ncbi:unnamed protein product [Pleuronectes platessa]|uniref:Uncharacterized protein n=1 Tax=Pleuronectes platessa TaxID=8262 RepID=A0A9N7V4G0_PLEPL|nr:unnamed protein product [Pleuronectes platessa]